MSLPITEAAPLLYQLSKWGFNLIIVAILTINQKNFVLKTYSSPPPHSPNHPPPPPPPLPLEADVHGRDWWE